MDLAASDWIGFTGVAILLLTYLLNLAKKIPSSGLAYIWLNIIGTGMAWLASWMIHYFPFVILEASWMLVSVIALYFIYGNIRPGHRSFLKVSCLCPLQYPRHRAC